MTDQAPIRNWQGVRDEVRRRIDQRNWRPGDTIPPEVELAREFGCARATVNRALRDLAEAGLLDRRRKAGTRVARNPVRRAQLHIPVIRDEIESRGLAFGHSVELRELRLPPAGIAARMRTTPGARLLHLQTLYTADGAPYVHEARWVNPEAIPEALEQDFAACSPNEWLVREVPFEGGDFTFSAITAGAAEAAALGCPERVGLFVLDRTTWREGQVITSVRLTFHQGYRIRTTL